MQEIVIGLNRIELNELVKSREALASLFGDKCDECVTLARISNKACHANLRFNNRPKTKSFYPSGSFTVSEYSFELVAEFNRFQGMVYQKTQETLEQRGIPCRVDTSGVHLFNGASLFGTGAMYYCIGNEYRWSGPDETESFMDLLCNEIALCALCMGVFYDMVNLVIMDNKTTVGDSMFETFSSYLKLDVTAAREQFKDDALSDDLQSSIREAVGLSQEADAIVMRKRDTLKTV